MKLITNKQTKKTIITNQIQFTSCKCQTQYINKPKSSNGQTKTVEHFSGLKLIKIERSPSPIIILPSLSSAQNATNTSNNRIKVSRQSMQSWQLNNSHVNKRSVQQQKMLTALKSAGARRGQFALFTSTAGGAHHRSKAVRAAAKSAIISHVSSGTSNNSVNNSGNSTPNGATNNTNDNNGIASAANAQSNVNNSKSVKRESLNSSNDMIFNADDEKPWSCKVCKRQYKWKNSLNCHIKNECGKPPKFFCERMCGYKTNIHSNMKRHMNSNCKPRFMQ